MATDITTAKRSPATQYQFMTTVSLRISITQPEIVERCNWLQIELCFGQVSDSFRRAIAKKYPNPRLALVNATA